MAMITCSLSLLTPPCSYRFPRSSPITISKRPFHVLSCTSPKTTPSLSSEQQVLRTLVESSGKKVPFVRTYENDLAQLSLVGAVCLPQALTAAAYGDQAAAEHGISGLPTNTMVVETVFPGLNDERATVSTRLFLPAREVQENANELKRSVPENIVSTTVSENILAMTTKQVAMQQLCNFKLVLFRPGTERDLENFENSSEVPESFTLRSSDEEVISKLAEVVCISSLQRSKRHYLGDLLVKRSSNLFHWIAKPKKVVSRDSSMTIYKLFEDEIVEKAKSVLETFRSMKESAEPVKLRPKYCWWTASVESELEKIGGPEFSAWTSEYVPAFRLQIDASRIGDVKFEGRRKSADNTWEVLLTKSQMVALADILDMYYEDIYSQPDKKLPFKLSPDNGSLFKKFLEWIFSSYNSFVASLASACLIITISAAVLIITISTFGLLYLPHFSKRKKYLGKLRSLPSSETEPAIYRPIDDAMPEAFCISVVKKVKDVFGCSGDIMTEKTVGAWIGEIPKNLKLANEDDNSTDSAASEKIDAGKNSSVQDVASYKVALSVDGKIVGIQPMSGVTVNQWAAAAGSFFQGLCCGRQISPGLFEPSLKIPFPKEVVLIMLLMSANSNCFFALARPIR